jgi:hypothetical protein
MNLLARFRYERSPTGSASKWLLENNITAERDTLDTIERYVYAEG